MNEKEAGFVNKYHPLIHENNIQQFYDEINKYILHIERTGYSAIIFLHMSLILNRYLKM